MDVNNFEYLSLRQIGYMYNYIQTVVPFVYDESLDLFSLLKKIIDYANEIGLRNNDLASTFDDLVSYVNKTEKEQVEFINNFVAKLRQEFEDWKTLYNQKYDEFTAEQIKNYNDFVAKIEKTLSDFETNITTLFNEFKSSVNEMESNFEESITTEQQNYETETNTQISNWKTEIDNILADLRTEIQNIDKQYNDIFNSFQSSTEADLQNYQSDLMMQINDAENNIFMRINDTRNEIENKISETNLTPIVEQEVTKLVESGKIGEALENLYGSIIRITYWDTNPAPTVTSDEPVYHYNPDTYVLTNCVDGSRVQILKNSMYIYNGYVYISEIVPPSIDVSLTQKNGSFGGTIVGMSENTKFVATFSRTDGDHIELLNTETGEVIKFSDIYIGTDSLGYTSSKVGVPNDGSYLILPEYIYDSRGFYEFTRKYVKLDTTTKEKTYTLTNITDSISINEGTVYIDEDNIIYFIYQNHDNSNFYRYSSYTGSSTQITDRIIGNYRPRVAYSDKNRLYLFGFYTNYGYCIYWCDKKTLENFSYVDRQSYKLSSSEPTRNMVSGYFNGNDDWLFIFATGNRQCYISGNGFNKLIEGSYYFDIKKGVFYKLDNINYTIQVYQNFNRETQEFENLITELSFSPIGINYIYINLLFRDNNYVKINTTLYDKSAKLNEIAYERKTV